jgi:hypothetical protein
MKNLSFISIVCLLFVTISMAQPNPPKTKLKKMPKTENFKMGNSNITLSTYYGFGETLGFELLKRTNTSIIGIGHSFYLPKPKTALVGTDVPVFNSDIPNSGTGYYAYSNHPMFNYKTINTAYYLIFGRQINRISINARIGGYSEAKYRIFQKELPPIGDETPYEFYHSKEVVGTKLLAGASITWTSRANTGVSLGFDTFNKATIGVFIHF